MLQLILSWAFVSSPHAAHTEFEKVALVLAIPERVKLDKCQVSTCWSIPTVGQGIQVGVNQDYLCVLSTSTCKPASRSELRMLYPVVSTEAESKHLGGRYHPRALVVAS
jgi:hypothetical protein